MEEINQTMDIIIDHNETCTNYLQYPSNSSQYMPYADNLSMTNNSLLTSTATMESSFEKQQMPMVYKKSFIRPILHKNKINKASQPKKGSQIINIGNKLINSRSTSMGHSSSTGNILRGSPIERPNIISKKNSNTFINIEDLLLLEEKFTQVLISINIQSPNLFNECFELLNFYNNSSLYDKFENYFTDKDSKKAIHNFILIMVYSIIMLYDISFNREFLNKISDHVLSILTKNHKSYLLLCEYILSKISSTARNNIWVKKLREMLSVKLTHIDLYSNDFKQYSTNSNTKSCIIEIEFYSEQIAGITRAILKNYPQCALMEDLFQSFKNINSNKINCDDLNKLFRKKVMRVLNKNASVLWSDNTFQEETRENSIESPYLKKPSKKPFTLVLDLDETLICFKIDPQDDRKGILRFRPCLDDFLEKVSKYYELIVFTSATKEYADPIINEIEKNNIYFDARFYREHTIVYKNDFVKDISKIGRDLSKITIVDNMPQNFRLQKENGIFIKAFWGEDNDDKSLYELGEILENIAKGYKDIREGLKVYKDEIMNKVTSNFFRNTNMQF